MAKAEGDGENALPHYKQMEALSVSVERVKKKQGLPVCCTYTLINI